MQGRVQMMRITIVMVIIVSIWGAMPTWAGTSPAATPGDGCPMPQGVSIPRATFFAPYGLGGSPLWAVGQGIPPTDRHAAPIPASPGSVVMLAGPTELGWFLKVLWVIAPTQYAPVTLSGRDPDGNPVRFDINGTGPTVEAVLDPAQPAIPLQHGGWAEFPSYVYFPRSGCYTFEAQWNGGSWQVQFPVEVPSPS